MAQHPTNRQQHTSLWHDSRLQPSTQINGRQSWEPIILCTDYNTNSVCNHCLETQRTAEETAKKTEEEAKRRKVRLPQPLTAKPTPQKPTPELSANHEDWSWQQWDSWDSPWQQCDSWKAEEKGWKEKEWEQWQPHDRWEWECGPGNSSYAGTSSKAGTSHSSTAWRTCRHQRRQGHRQGHCQQQCQSSRDMQQQVLQQSSLHKSLSSTRNHQQQKVITIRLKEAIRNHQQPQQDHQV